MKVISTLYTILIDHFVNMTLATKLQHSIFKMMVPLRRLKRYKSRMPQEIVTPSEALEWCQNFLRGAWSNINADELVLDRIHGGLSNYLYSCALPDNVQPIGDEPRKVLLRIYGETHQKHHGALLIDSIVCTLLSERRLGPRVYGVLPEGRLEQLVDAKALVVAEIHDPKISQKIARLLSDLHQIDMPLIKEPIWLFKTIARYLADVPEDPSVFPREEDREIFRQFRSVCDFTAEFQNLKKILASVDSPVCFTHNDFQPGNILRLKSHPEHFTVIDFEYCSYNYRGFDIGNHFCEHMFDYQSATEWPFFKVDFSNYPNKTHQMNFLSAYVDGLLSSRKSTEDGEASVTTTDDEREALINKLMKEANFYSMASDFLWTLWSINMAISTTIKFGYMEYGLARLTAYHLKRYLLLEANEIPPRLTDEVLQSDKNPFYKK